MSRAFLWLSLLGGCAAFLPSIDECGDASSCTTCLDPSHGSGNCGWCAPTAVVYADGTPGKRCADLRDKSHGGGWQCSGKLMTDQCLQGWVCGGDATNFQCIPAAQPGDGNPTFADCQAGCTPRPSFQCTDPSKGQCFACSDPKDPTCTQNYTACQESCVDESLYSCNPKNGQCEKCTSPGPQCVGQSACATSCAVKYECDFPTDTAQLPTCKPCTDPSSQSCQYATSADCSTGCNWNYECDLNGPSGPTCKKAKNGIPQLDWCTQQCVVTYVCDEAAKTCNATQGGQSGGFHNKSSCDATCPAKPSPIVPVELIGVWRGLEIHQGFARGEWTANVTAHSITVYTPDKKVYVSGSAVHRVLPNAKGGETGELWLNSTKGALTGSVKMIYGDFNLEPELAYVAWGVSEADPTLVITDYDTGMTTSSDKVLGMYRCKDDANCVFQLPKGLPPIARDWRALEDTTVKTTAISGGELTKTSGGEADALDQCNTYTTCNSCIGATAGPLACGWCTTPVQYNDSSAPKYQCAGSKSGTASGWTCFGVYRTLSCFDYSCDPVSRQCKQAAPGQGGSPTLASCEASCTAPPSPWERCSINGNHRGLQIDINYAPGEWMANFSVFTNFTTATFTFVPNGYSYSGKLLCRNAKNPTKIGLEGDFKLSLANGTTLYGIYLDGGNQAETEGLSMAFSNIGMSVPPTDFKSAMPGLNASVFGYTKCADYKKGICVF